MGTTMSPMPARDLRNFEPVGAASTLAFAFDICYSF